MIKSDSDIYRLIFERAKQWNTIKPRYKAEEEGEMSDSDDQSGTIQLFSVCGETYDFDKGTILSLATVGGKSTVGVPNFSQL